MSWFYNTSILEYQHQIIYNIVSFIKIMLPHLLFIYLFSLPIHGPTTLPHNTSLNTLSLSFSPPSFYFLLLHFFFFNIFFFAILSFFFFFFISKKKKNLSFSPTFCKVEFYQLSCWLYSVPNLLVFQQLVTLYLGGNHVRVVSERV